MSVLQKANAYDTAVQKLNDFINKWGDTKLSPHDSFIQELKQIIPKITESEDEKINKELNKAAEKYQKQIEENNPNAEAYDFFNAFIACANWLEQQNLKQQDKPIWTIADAKKGDVLVHNDCTFIFLGIEDGLVQALEKNLLEPTPFGKAYEKDDDLPYSNDYRQATNEERTTFFNEIWKKGYEWDEVKKEPNKIREFEDDDWILSTTQTFKDQPMRIIGFDRELGYKLETQEGNQLNLTQSIVEQEFRHWTIEDAKNGDVLINDVVTVLFRKIGNELWNDVIDYHILMFNQNLELKVQINYHHAGIIDNNRVFPYIPTTKKQRQKFFQKMREFNYQWDSEKKELK